MRAILSSTYDPKYFFFLPIVCWTWNRLGVGVVCYTPNKELDEKTKFVFDTLYSNKAYINVEHYTCPENKEATYAQCSRLFGAYSYGIVEDEVLVVGDVDMAMLKIPATTEDITNGGFTIFGVDLVPEKQYPMCYISATKRTWRETFHVADANLQESLDRMLAHEECENMRGNLWGRDQETAFNVISKRDDTIGICRAKAGTQFASNRLDRDDAFLMDRDVHDAIDFHLPRPGYEESNFMDILTILKTKYPYDDLSWMVEYRNEYIKLL